MVALVLDRSASQRFGDRTGATDKAAEILKQRLEAIPNLEVRVVDGGTDGTERPAYVRWADILKVEFDRPQAMYPPPGGA